MTREERRDRRERASQRRGSSPNAERPCVLVIDDDATIRVMLQTALEEHYKIVSHPHGEEVLRLIEAHSPRLLLLDIYLPGSDGYEVCKRVRAEAKTKRLPILFMTIRKDDATFIKSLESGGDAVIFKPFEIPALQERIESLIRPRPSS